MSEAIDVSAVIPTVGRPSLREAVESVLAQESCSSEAIVVLDAPERIYETRVLLEGLPHTLLTTNRMGAPTARNLGLDAARGRYIGYLDDDDVWLPAKSRRQIEAISNAVQPGHTFSVVASEFVRADGSISRSAAEVFDPDRTNFANYLVGRRRLRYGRVFFNTPAILGPAGLLKAMQWDASLTKHQDWDLLIRLVLQEKASFVILNAPLVRVFQGSADSISASGDWRNGASWLRKHDVHVTGRARADFVLLHIMLHALRSRSLEGIRDSICLMPGASPHLVALTRAAAGLLLGR